MTLIPSIPAITTSHSMAMVRLALFLVAVVTTIEDTRSENTYLIAPIPDNIIAKLQGDNLERDGDDYALAVPGEPRLATRKPGTPGTPRTPGKPRTPRRPSFLIGNTHI